MAKLDLAPYMTQQPGRDHISGMVDEIASLSSLHVFCKEAVSSTMHVVTS